MHLCQVVAAAVIFCGLFSSALMNYCDLLKKYESLYDLESFVIIAHCSARHCITQCCTGKLKKSIHTRNNSHEQNYL